MKINRMWWLLRKSLTRWGELLWSMGPITLDLEGSISSTSLRKKLQRCQSLSLERGVGYSNFIRSTPLSIDAITNVNDPASIQKQYMFKLPLNKLYFDEYKRLVLTEIIKLNDQNF